MSDEAGPSSSSEPAPPITIKIISNDSQVFSVSYSAIKQMKAFDVFINNYTEEELGTLDPIPTENVNGRTMKLVCEWCEHHKGEPIPTQTIPREIHIPVFDANLMEGLDNMELFNLIQAADYLAIKKLLFVSCKKASNLVVGKTSEEMKVIFGILTDEQQDIIERRAAKKAEKAAGYQEYVQRYGVKRAAEKDADRAAMSVVRKAVGVQTVASGSAGNSVDVVMKDVSTGNPEAIVDVPMEDATVVDGTDHQRVAATQTREVPATQTPNADVADVPMEVDTTDQAPITTAHPTNVPAAQGVPAINEAGKEIQTQTGEDVLVDDDEAAQ